MKTLVLGAGVIGVCTAWHLLELGHEVTVVERQSGAALETSLANGGQISVSYCEPWASREAPLKLLKWMFRSDAPLLFRPQLDWHQWAWGLQFLAQCNDAAFERNVKQLVALGAYSHAALKQIISSTGIEFERLEKGIAHILTDDAAVESAIKASGLMARFGVDRRVVSRQELLEIEPAYAQFGSQIKGGTFTPSDESGDAKRFTQALAARCAERGAVFLYHHDVEQLQWAGATTDGAKVTDRLSGTSRHLKADNVVVALGSYTSPLLRRHGIDLAIYPGKGYSATFRILRPELAPSVSVIDDGVKCAITRLGDQLRVAGTIQLSGFDLSLDSPLARARCRMLAERTELLLPGVCDTRSEQDGGNPQFWTGLRPSTPTNVPYIGRTRLAGLWVNAGHGTLGWTHAAGSGKALAELISGKKPETSFGFFGY